MIRGTFIPRQPNCKMVMCSTELIYVLFFFDLFWLFFFMMDWGENCDIVGNVDEKGEEEDDGTCIFAWIGNAGFQFSSLLFSSLPFP